MAPRAPANPGGRRRPRPGRRRVTREKSAPATAGWGPRASGGPGRAGPVWQGAPPLGAAAGRVARAYGNLKHRDWLRVRSGPRAAAAPPRPAGRRGAARPARGAVGAAWALAADAAIARGPSFSSPAFRPAAAERAGGRPSCLYVGPFNGPLLVIETVCLKHRPPPRIVNILVFANI